MLLVFGREPLALRNIYASGGVGFLHDLIEVAGGTNVFADVRRESVQATTELILARAPEVIRSLLAEPERLAFRVKHDLHAAAAEVTRHVAVEALVDAARQRAGEDDEIGAAA